MASYESFYPGIDYMSNMPSYYSPPIKGYQASVSEIGMAVDPRTANQLGELNRKLNPGTKVIEVQGTFPESWESVPNQHLDEIKRLSKITGVQPTLHGPLVEASGVSKEGWTEENRLGAEKQMESAVSRGHRLDPKGNISVTFHSTTQLPELRPHIMVEEKGERKKIEQGLFIINEGTGQIANIRPEKRFFEEGEKFTGKEIKFEADKELKKRNEEVWVESLYRVTHAAGFGENNLGSLRKLKEGNPELYSQVIKGGTINPELIKSERDKREFEGLQRDLTQGQIYLRDSYRGLKELFDRAWIAANKGENGKKNEKDIRELRKFADESSQYVSKRMGSEPEKIEQLGTIIQNGIRTMQNLNETPKMWRSMYEFLVEKSAETFANVAVSAYNKFGETSPIVNIENPPASSQGLSTGEDLKRLVEESRKKMAEKLSKKMSKGKAEDIAKKMIGATWDVGHINLLRKKGYSEKEIIEETKKIAPFVKHVHLSDNFGLDHTELPMGMGNVPLKPMMKELKKAGFKGKEIIEAGNWWQYFAQHGGGNPFKPSIEAFDSPIYAMKEGPTWSNTGVYGGYFSGFGPVNPPVHHNIYGAGFQTLPVELGGEIPGGERGRFAGGGAAQ